MIPQLVQPMSALLSAAFILAGCAGGTVPAADQMHVRCLSEPVAGACRSSEPGFYYDYASDSCKRFLSGGCGGRVPFASMDECLRACGGRPGG